MSRRRFVLGAASAGALGVVASGLPGGPALAAGRATSGIAPLDEIWSWQHKLVDFGTRYTGSVGHGRFVDWLGEQFAAIPGFSLHTDRLSFNRWLARDYSLSVTQHAAVGRSGPVPVTYYHPYSGTTPAGGVTGKLVDLGYCPPAIPGSPGSSYTPEFWARANGAIALVRTLPPTFPLASGQIATGGYEPGKSSIRAAVDYEAYAGLVTTPVWQGILSPVPLLDAKNAGVLAVVCAWTGMPDEEIVNQYNPFTTPYPSTSGLATRGDRGCPAVWVGDATGRRLAVGATTGQLTATLVLSADITAGAATETVWGVLRGSGSGHGNIIINTHTDGPNATEENGGLALLALAKYFAGQPSRNRDLYFVLVTGHFQLPQFTATIPNARPVIGSDATSVWMRDHPEIYHHAVAGVTIEHLGCTMWTNDPVSGRYVPTGGYDWGATYTAQRRGSLHITNTEQRAYLAAVRHVNDSGWRDYPVATVLPGVLPVYLGEGAPLYAAGLGTVSLVPGPTYLLQAGDAQHPGRLNLDKLDKNLMYGQILALAKTIETIDRASTSAL